MARRKTRGKNSAKPRKWLKITRQMHLKLLILFFLITASLLGLTGSLMYIEHNAGFKYQKIVLGQQIYDSVTIPYRRGDITDCRGNVLVTSIDVYNVILDCYVLTSQKAYLEPTVKALMSSFPKLDEEEIRRYAKEEPNNRYRVLARKVSNEEVQKFMAFKNDKDSKTAKYIKGIWFEKEYDRSYPHQSLASSVIGFTSAGNVGVEGLENYYNDTLNGINGRQYGYLNSDNAVERSVKNARDGYTIVTTLDMNIQSVVEKKIDEFIKAYKDEARPGPGAERIGVILENPNTGGILAMADYPDYDLSNPHSLEQYYTPKEIRKMSEAKKLENLQALWRNYCISDTFEPGSPQKPLTVAAGLDSGKLTGNERFECDGYEKIADRRINCVNVAGHGTETVQGSLMDSCNDALMQMVRIIGKEDFCKYQSIFGMGFRTNIDLPGEARTDSLIRSVEDTSSVDLASSSFGQNFNCTMIQMISAFSALINGGNYYQPFVVSKITDESGNTIEEKKPMLLKQIVSKGTSDTLKKYLYETVTNGTGNTAKVPGYSMGGKTGTAEKQPRDTGNYLVSFIGYLPQERPELVIYTVIDTPNQDTHKQKQAHSTFAQNLAREILEEVLPYMNIFKDEKVEKGAPKKKDTNMYTAIEGYEARAALGEAVTYP